MRFDDPRVESLSIELADYKRPVTCAPVRQRRRFDFTAVPDRLGLQRDYPSADGPNGLVIVADILPMRRLLLPLRWILGLLTGSSFKVQATAGAPELGSAGPRWGSFQAQQLRRPYESEAGIPCAIFINN